MPLTPAAPACHNGLAGGRTSVYFQAAVPADAWPAELEDAILMVAAIADDREKAV